jgi:hypothetical protein
MIGNSQKHQNTGGQNPDNHQPASASVQEQRRAMGHLTNLGTGDPKISSRYWVQSRVVQF